MKAGSLVYYVNDDAVSQDGSHIHDAQWDGDPDMRCLQPWDSWQKEEEWLMVGAVERRHDDETWKKESMCGNSSSKVNSVSFRSWRDNLEAEEGNFGYMKRKLNRVKFSLIPKAYVVFLGH